MDALSFLGITLAFVALAWCVVVTFAPFHSSSLPASYP